MDEYRALHTERLEDLLRRSYEALDEAHRGREVGVAQLLSSARGILDSLAKLHGLNQPDRNWLPMRQQESEADLLDAELGALVTVLKNHAMTEGIVMPTPGLDALEQRGATYDGTGGAGGGD
ncbi:hypothetical protein [Gordonia jacobaea]|uniref:hypothetical protein n=1 Tax=Gordonia jacobaea TaxID=122202 RepID=UPI003D7149D8